jgi:hypothetical protein
VVTVNTSIINEFLLPLVAGGCTKNNAPGEVQVKVHRNYNGPFDFLWRIAESAAAMLRILSTFFWM